MTDVEKAAGCLWTHVVRRLLALNTLHWYLRIPVKWAVLGLAVLLVCYPNPSLLIRHLRHISNPNAMIEPDAPALQPLVDELSAGLEGNLSAREVLKRVELLVYETIPYEWDWNTWGAADYLPTVAEVIAMGKEDCDGRAVLAASLLRRLGFRAWLVSDFAHLWVATDVGETMAPGKTRAVVATEQGMQIRENPVGEMLKAGAYGIAVFPLPRELIVLVVAWVLLLRGDTGLIRCAIGLALLFTALLLVRAGSERYLHPVLWMQWGGVATLAAGVVALTVWRRRKTRVKRPIDIC